MAFAFLLNSEGNTCNMEHLSRKIKRIATLEARLAALKADMQLEMQRLNCHVQSGQGLQTDANKKSSHEQPIAEENWGDCGTSSETICAENWEA